MGSGEARTGSAPGEGFGGVGQDRGREAGEAADQEFELGGGRKGGRGGEEGDGVEEAGVPGRPGGEVEELWSVSVGQDLSMRYWSDICQLDVYLSLNGSKLASIS